MPATLPHCLNCSAAIPADYWNSAEETTCRRCTERVVAVVFPAIDRTAGNHEPSRLQAEADASCFYHADNQAVVACDNCGRFLCKLCDLDIDGRHLCPSCLERGVSLEERRPDALENRRTQYDSLALHLLTWPVVTFWFPLFAAPAALYFVVRHWNTPMSILPRTRVRLWIALLLGLVEVGAMVWFVLYLIWWAPALPAARPPAGAAGKGMLLP